MNRPLHILPVIILSQFCGTALWFAGNAVMFDLQEAWALQGDVVGPVTNAVQIGFIVGTLLFAVLAIADRFAPRSVFLMCALLGALANAALLIAPRDMSSLITLRLLTGFFLAGIYPVGMKIAASWYDQGLGRALGYLVGALVLGTAFPHLVRGLDTGLPWERVMIVASMLAAAGGVAMYVLVPDGPHLPKGAAFNPRALGAIFTTARLRASAFGYFGHMWELYALWAFLPVWLLAYTRNQGLDLNISLWTFAVIAVGAVTCAWGGIVSLRWGSARVSASMLAISGVCCLLSPLAFEWPPWAFLGFVLLWGATVSSDSPQFSALNAANAPRAYVGSVLTMINSLGFLITVLSIQILTVAAAWLDPGYLFLLLAPGPVIGLLSMRPLLRSRT
ncbi:MAG: MFS transporter [Gammaproteobacteria bacterium]